MAYTITLECTECRACLNVCPNSAISAEPGLYRIDPFLCTECLGFAEESQCVESCAPGAIVLLGA